MNRVQSSDESVLRENGFKDLTTLSDLILWVRVSICFQKFERDAVLVRCSNEIPNLLQQMHPA